MWFISTLLVLINTSLLQTGECKALDETEKYEEENEGSDDTENMENGNTDDERKDDESKQDDIDGDNEIKHRKTENEDTEENKEEEKGGGNIQNDIHGDDEMKNEKTEPEATEEEEEEEEESREKESKEEASKESEESSETETDYCDGEKSIESGDSSGGESKESDEEELISGSFKRNSSGMKIKNILDLIKSSKGGSLLNTGPFTKILGGKDADIKNHPWQASLQDKSTGLHFCGAVIIHRYWALTAAHCVHDKLQRESEFRVVAGTTDFSDVTIQSDIKRFIMHKEFNQGPGYRSNDVALIELETDLTGYDAVTPVPISPSREFDNTFVSRKCTISGWGFVAPGNLPMILQEADMRALSSCQCRRHFGNNFYEPAHFCVSNQRAASCEGDSGGPLVCDGILIGVASYGITDFCIDVFPTVFTRLSNYREWMKDETGVDFNIVVYRLVD